MYSPEERVRIAVAEWGRLGHASIAITGDTYSHVAPGLQKAAAMTFAEVVGGAE